MQVLEPSMDFADTREWPNEENEASLLRRELITTFESPSIVVGHNFIFYYFILTYKKLTPQ